MPKLRDTPKTRMDRAFMAALRYGPGHARGDRQGHHAADAQIYRHLLQALAQSGWLYPGGAAHPHPPVLQRPPALRCLRCRVPRGHAGAERGLVQCLRPATSAAYGVKAPSRGVSSWSSCSWFPGPSRVWWRRFCDPVKFAIACGFAQEKKTAGAATPSGPKGKEKLIRPYFRGLEGDCQV